MNVERDIPPKGPSSVGMYQKYTWGSITVSVPPLEKSKEKHCPHELYGQDAEGAGGQGGGQGGGNAIAQALAPYIADLTQQSLNQQQQQQHDL